MPLANNATLTYLWSPSGNPENASQLCYTTTADGGTGFTDPVPCSMALGSFNVGPLIYRTGMPVFLTYNNSHLCYYTGTP